MSSTDTETQAKRPGRPPTPKSEKVNITYVPRDGDPHEVVWNNHRFQANVPRPVGNAIMIAQAKGNPYFEVEGHEKKAGPDPSEPKTAEAYRAHAVEWFKKAKTAQDFEARWDAEADLRERVGVGTDDLEWLESIAGPRLSELKKADQ